MLEIFSFITLFDEDDLGLIDIALDIVIYSFILVGIFGFAFNKKILFCKFWLYLIPIGFIYDMYTLYDMDWEIETKLEVYLIIAFAGISILPLMFFQYLALYKYSLKSPDIWKLNFKSENRDLIDE